MMTLSEKLNGLNSNFGVWQFNSYLRVTYVSEGWLVVWDHRDSPPTRYDCKTSVHREASALAADKLQELSAA
jgi:hypothetical protein